MKTDEGASILTLWDSYTKDMDNLYGLLMDGKSELAAVLLQERKSLHNGQSRDLLILQLQSLESCLIEKTIESIPIVGGE